MIPAIWTRRLAKSITNSAKQRTKPFGVTAPAATWYVARTGSDAGDGSSWSTAKQAVQAGLNAAVAGDQVWVATGTYVENVTLKSGVALYSGFAGTETDLSQRNWGTNVTILDGNKAGSVVTAPTGATATTRIDGFTIRNGAGTAYGSYRYGGGVHSASSAVVIANNTISGNTAGNITYSGNEGLGGGIYCGGGSPAILNNIITGNSSGLHGGDIYCRGCPNAIISGNTVTRWG